MKTPNIKNKKLAIVIIAFVSIFFLIVKFLEQQELLAVNNKDTAYVLHVVDGDTVELSNGEKVRYLGIDTPELRERNGDEWIYKPMPYAEEAKDFNKKLVEGKNVELVFDVQRKDKYNRLLAYVYIEDKMVNLELVRQGYAMVYTYPPNVKYVEEFLSAQKEARTNKRGIWKDLEGNTISSSEVKENLGLIKAVQSTVLDTYLSEDVLILSCKNNFKVAIFKNNLKYFPKEALRSPDNYFKYKTIRVYGIIKPYKGSYEIVLRDPSHIEIIQ